jgi:ethanolamine transporter EutH
MENSLKAQDLDIKKKIVKYLLFALIVGISVRYIPDKPIENTQILLIAAVAAITFGLIDMISPSIKVT